MADTSIMVGVAVNSVALLAIVFHSGKLVGRLEQVEKKTSELETRFDHLPQETAFQGLTEKIGLMDTHMSERIDHVRRGVHDLRNELMKFYLEKGA